MLSAPSKASPAAIRPAVEWRRASVPAAAEGLAAAGYSRQLAELLARRGVEDAAAAEAFLNPRLEQLHDPRLLAGLDAAVERLLAARRDSERVAIVGDYDVDGVSGTALLSAVFRACGLEVFPILPHRMRDGYGFQPAHVERARAERCGLVVTIDCGTTSIAAAEAAIAAGLDVVVTDHHLPGGDPLPEEVVQINPHREGCSYPFAELSGAGLALKLALATAQACQRKVDPRILMRVACLGTVADLVPLVGENRVIAAVGLSELGRTRSPGLLALIRVAGLRSPLSAADIGFRLGPRLNAPGRMDSAEPALELLLSRDPRRATELAEELDRLNRDRQDEERRTAEEAREVFIGRKDLPAILLAWSEGWHRGVVGIAAGRLARDFHRPTILLSLEGDSATGSGRSIPGINLHRFLSRSKDELARFGGHAQAVGLTARREDLESLRERWEREAAESWAEEVAVRSYEYELDLGAAEVTRRLYGELRRLEPHGKGNEQPLVRIRGPLRLLGAPRFFGRGHVSAMAVGGDGGRIRLVGWDWQDRAHRLVEGEFEVLGHLEEDRYRGGAELRLLDSRPYRGVGES